MRLASHIHFFGRQLRLVNEAYAFVGPFESLNHGYLVIEPFSHLFIEKQNLEINDEGSID
jgi:hypothetical protein